jgi:hypothetical protein
MRIFKPVIRDCVIRIVSECHGSGDVEKARAGIVDLLGRELHTRIDKALGRIEGC